MLLLNEDNGCNEFSLLWGSLPSPLEQGSQPLAHHHGVALLLPEALPSACKPPRNPRPVAANLRFPFCSQVTKQNAAPASHSSEPTGNHKSEGKHNIQRELAKGQTLGWAEGLGKGSGEPVKAAPKRALTHVSTLAAPRHGTEGKLRVRAPKALPLLQGIHTYVRIYILHCFPTPLLPLL